MGIMNDIKFNGQSLNRLGFAVRHFPIHSAARRSREFIPIIGRSGDVINDNGRYENVEFSYEVNTVFMTDLENKTLVERRLVDWLLSQNTYARFEDSTVPDCFTYAVCTDIAEINTNHLDGYLSTVLTFNRQPFWYTLEGQRERLVNNPLGADIELINPEAYGARPTMTITGVGNYDLYINGQQIHVGFGGTSSQNHVLTIDFENNHAYSGSQNMNNYISADYFPDLRPGLNMVKLVGESSATQLDSISIIPNWRRL